MSVTSFNSYFDPKVVTAFSLKIFFNLLGVNAGNFVRPGVHKSIGAEIKCCVFCNVNITNHIWFPIPTPSLSYTGQGSTPGIRRGQVKGIPQTGQEEPWTGQGYPPFCSGFDFSSLQEDCRVNFLILGIFGIASEKKRIPLKTALWKWLHLSSKSALRLRLWKITWLEKFDGGAISVYSSSCFSTTQTDKSVSGIWNGNEIAKENLD